LFFCGSLQMSGTICNPDFYHHVSLYSVLRVAAKMVLFYCFGFVYRWLLSLQIFSSAVSSHPLHTYTNNLSFVLLPSLHRVSPVGEVAPLCCSAFFIVIGGPCKCTWESFTAPA
jgi:hypothetical protein